MIHEFIYMARSLPHHIKTTHTYTIYYLLVGEVYIYIKLGTTQPKGRGEDKGKGEGQQRKQSQ